MSAPKLTLVSDGEPVDDRALADLGRDDIGNAERLIARFGHDLRYTPGLGWFVFDKQRWRLDPEPWPLVKKLAQQTARAIEREAEALRAEARGLKADDVADDDEEAKPVKGGDTEDTPLARKKKRLQARATQLLAWRTSSSNSARLAAMIAQAQPHLQHAIENWNAQPTLFNVTNGTLELDGLEPNLRAFRRDDYLTHMAGVAYDPAAKCDAFRGFVARVLPGEKLAEGGEDFGVQKFVQRGFGVCLIDSVRDQAIIMHHGAGANGKSTMMNRIAHALGSYCMTVAIQSLMYNKNASGSGPSPDIARIAERPRLIRVSEPEPGQQLSEGGVKSLTGGEPIVARKLNEAPVEFLIVGKIHAFLNNRPIIRGGDDGIWRRIQLVPWRVQIPEQEQRDNGPALEAAMEAEGSGILNWLIEGLCDYYEGGGLNPPEQVRAETQAYRSDSDVVGRFIAEACDRDEGLRVEINEIYEAFKLWSKDEGSKDPMSAQSFARKLSDRGFGSQKSNGAKFRTGITIHDEWKERVKAGALAELEREADRQSARRERAARQERHGAGGDE